VADWLSSLSRKNKPDPYAARRDFINAILCAERPILSKKNKTEGLDDLDAIPDYLVRAFAATAPGYRIVRARAGCERVRADEPIKDLQHAGA
jgi:hypothetical protein